MSISRRTFMFTSATAIGGASALGSVVASATPKYHHWCRRQCATEGYGELVKDPNGLLDLPKGFRYRMFSQEGTPMTDGAPVPLVTKRLPARLSLQTATHYSSIFKDLPA